LDCQEAITERAWDQASEIPERLALLAAIGPALDPRAWRYNRLHESWYCVEAARAMPGNEYVGVHQNGSVSLTLIANKWHINRAAAMTLVGDPDVR
jgi:hypothetical protein